VLYLLRTGVYPSTQIEGQYGFTMIPTLVAQFFSVVDEIRNHLGATLSCGGSETGEESYISDATLSKCKLEVALL